MPNHFHYVEADEIDHDKWDEVIGECANENPFAYSDWLDLVCKKWAAVMNTDGTVIMPIPLKKKFGVTYISQPLFTQQLGLFSSSRITANQVSLALAAIPRRYLKIHLQLNTSNYFEDLHLPHRPTYCLNLKADHISLANKYHLSHKRNIAKAKKNGLVIREDKNMSEFIRKFRQTTGKKDEHMNPAAYELMARIIKSMPEKEYGKLMNCYSENGELVAGLFYMHSKTRIINLFNFSTSEGRSLNAMPFLIDQWIANFAGTKMILDFEGSSIPSLATFYSRFGAEKKLYPLYTRNLTSRLRGK
jgi:hypothetical protein